MFYLENQLASLACIYTVLLKVAKQSKWFLSFLQFLTWNGVVLDEMRYIIT